VNFGQRLEDLLAFTRMGQIEPTDALSGLYALQDERKTEKQARQAAALEAQQAQQDSLMGLASMAYESASAGDPLAQLIQNPQFVAGASQLGMRPKQFAKQMGYYEGGVSTINPGLPDSEAANIIEAVTSKQAEGLDIGTIKSDVHSVAKSQLGPLYP
jgi:hypothetical protein